MRLLCHSGNILLLIALPSFAQIESAFTPLDPAFMGKVATPATGATSTLNEGLVAYWKMDEESAGSAPVTRVDSEATGTPQSLTDNNTVASATGTIGNGAHVLGSANSEWLSRSDSADLSVSGSFTFSFWVYFDTVTGSPGVLCKDDGSSDRDYVSYLSASKLNWYVFDSTSGSSSVESGTLNATTWYFVCLWYDAADKKARISLNNGATTVAASALTNGPRDGTYAFQIGAYGTTRVFNGTMDEVGFWKRALTDAERTELYNGGAGKTYPF